MTDVATAMDRIRKVAGERGGVKRLADETGLPYTTVHSFARRKPNPGSKKNDALDVFDRLATAAERIEARGDESEAAA